MSRTHRRPYSGSRRFDVTCRNHGACGYCQSNRMHRFVKRLRTAAEELYWWGRGFDRGRLPRRVVGRVR